MKCGDDGIISADNITTGEIAGTGNFDKILRTLNLHINEEFEKDRITGSNYSTVYLGAMNQALETSVMFTLNAPKVTQEVRLIKEQINQAEKNTALIEAQIRNLNADTNIKVKQLELMEAEKLGTEAGTVLTKAKTAESEYTLTVMETTVDVNKAQIGKISAETTYTSQQEKTNKQQELLLGCQQSLARENALLIKQKQDTEKAQTHTLVGDMAPDGTANGHEKWKRGGVMGAQYALLLKQKEGFDRDAQQKVAKMMVDTFAVGASLAGETTGSEEAGLSFADMKDVINEARKGINLNPT